MNPRQWLSSRTNLGLSVLHVVVYPCIVIVVGITGLLYGIGIAAIAGAVTFGVGGSIALGLACWWPQS
jgi:ABC-type Co2+ transport system permease subunit